MSESALRHGSLHHFQRPCRTPTMAAYTRQQLRDIEVRAFDWEQSVLTRLAQAVDIENLPSRPRKDGEVGVRPHATPPGNELAPLIDPGCVPRARRDAFGVHNRYAFDLWEGAVSAPCIGGGNETRGGGGRREAAKGQVRSTCSWDSFAFRKPCLIYSLGSNGDTVFEEAALASTRHCVVHTFDCSLRRQVVATLVDRLGVEPYKSAGRRALGLGPNETAAPHARGPPMPEHVQLSERHWLHLWCVAAANSSLPQLPRGWVGGAAGFKSLEQIQRSLGHAAGSLSLLKIDIEAHEWKIFASWRAQDAWLPEQLVGEVHCTNPRVHRAHRYVSVGEATALLTHFHRIGYRLASLRLDNRKSTGLDVTFVRAQCPSISDEPAA